MVLGLTRPRLRSSLADLSSLDAPHLPAHPANSWHSERGEILFETACDVIGGFPGYARVGGRLLGHRLRITERYLLVGDGHQFGFGLPIRQLDGSAFIPVDDDEDFALRLFYRDGFATRLFTIQFQGMRLPSRGGLRAERAQLSLLRAGFHDRFADAPPSPPSYAVTWEETASFEFENVIWRGEAIVPRAVGLDSIPGTVWLTTRSLIWGSETATGVQRIPLTDLTDVAAEKLADRDETPVLFVGIGDDTTGHFDLPFVFNQQSTPDRNLRERGALLVGLRSRGLPIGHSTPARQPWWDRSNESFPSIPPRQRIATDDGVAVIPVLAFDDLPELTPTKVVAPIPVAASEDYPEWPLPASTLPSLIWEPPADDDADTNEIVDETPATILDVVLAEWSAEPDGEPLELNYDVQLATNWIAPTPEESNVAPDDQPVDDAVVASKPAGLTPTSPEPETVTANMTTYERQTETILATLQAAIRDRANGTVTPIDVHIPSAADQATALAELQALNADGTITDDELHRRSTRLTVLGDTCVRLLSLIDVRDRGIISDDDLNSRLKFLLAQLRPSDSAKTGSESDTPIDTIVMRTLRRAG